MAPMKKSQAAGAGKRKGKQTKLTAAEEPPSVADSDSDHSDSAVESVPETVAESVAQSVAEKKKKVASLVLTDEQEKDMVAWVKENKVIYERGSKDFKLITKKVMGR